MIEKFIDFLIEFEGLRLQAYKDGAGKWTIGIGTVIYPSGLPVKQGDVCTESIARDYVKLHCNDMFVNVDRLFVKPMNDNQKIAVYSFCYNLGVSAFTGSHLLKKINVNPNDVTIRDEFNKWIYDAKKQVEPGLIIRRGKEADIYFKI